MKKIVAAVCCIAMAAFMAGCSETGNGGGGEGETGKGMTWEKLVEAYPFMGNFPKYDGDIELPQYSDSRGVESVALFDYTCEAAMATDYYAKLDAAGFTGNPAAEGMFGKVIGGDEYVFTGAHAAGNFGMVFSRIPKE